MSRRDALMLLLDSMEKERHVLLTRLDRLPPDLLAKQPPSGGWSVAQVMTHLAIAEEGAMAYQRKKLEVRKHDPVGFASRWRLLVLNTAMLSPLKYKAPPIVADVPSTSYAVARERWDAVRKDMRSAYGELEEPLFGHDLYKHPVVGKLNVMDGLRFMQQHVRRHMDQIGRILKSQESGS